MSFLVDSIPHLSQLHAGNKHVLGRTQGKDAWKSMSGFLSFMPCAFIFPQLTVFYILLLYHSHGCHCTLSPVSSHRQSLNLWMVWGTPNTHALEVLCCAVLCLVTQLCPTLCEPVDCSRPGSSVHGDSPDKNTGVGCHALLPGSSRPRDWTQVSRTAGGFFTIWATREVQEYWSG